MPKIKANGIDIYYEIHGRGQPLLLIGGLSNDLTDYAGPDGIIGRLSEHHQLIVFDNRGVGRSDKPNRDYSIEMMAQDTADLLDGLDVKPVSVVGISMGGRIAIELALSHPELVSHLILVSTAARTTARPTFSAKVFFLLARLANLYGSKQYHQPAYAFLHQQAASRDYNAVSRLGQIKVPTLVLHGQSDRIIPISLAKETAAKITDARFASLPGGHMFLFLNPALFVEEINNFLQG